MVGVFFVVFDDSLLSRVDWFLYKVESFFVLISGFVVFGLMVLVVILVGGRNLFECFLFGYVDWIEQVMLLIVFMGIVFIQCDGGYICMDMLIGQFKGCWFYVVEFLIMLVIFVLMVLLVWGIWVYFECSFEFVMFCWSMDSLMDIGLLFWFVKLLVLVVFLVLSLWLGL